MHHGEGDGGALVDAMARDFPDVVVDVLQVGGDGAVPSVRRSCGSRRCIEEGLEL